MTRGEMQRGQSVCPGPSSDPEAELHLGHQDRIDDVDHAIAAGQVGGGTMDDRLGMHLSHGCVRLNINNAKWIYDNIPRGTTVVSY